MAVRTWLALALATSATADASIGSIPRFQSWRGASQPGAGAGHVVRLRGGDAPASGMVVRLRTRDGMKRLTLKAGDSATLNELQRAVLRECKVPVAKQRFSRTDGNQAEVDLLDGERSMAELGIGHGTVLQLSIEGATAAAAAASGGSSGAGGAAASASPGTATASGGAGARRARKRGENMQAYLDKRAEREIVLKAPPPATCEFCSIDGRASKKL